MKKKLIPIIIAITTILLIPLLANADGAEKLENPLKCDDLTCVFTNTIKIILGVMSLFAVIIFIWGGFMMLTSGGNAEKVKKAKDALLWSSIGVITIMLSWMLIQFIIRIIAAGSTVEN